MTRAPTDNVKSARKSLEVMLSGYFDKSISEMPAALSEFVSQIYTVMAWPELSAEERRAVANAWDRQHRICGPYEPLDPLLRPHYGKHSSQVPPLLLQRWEWIAASKRRH